MENDILECLEDLGYNGPLLDCDQLFVAVEKGTQSIEFTQLIEWLTTELGELAGLEDHVRAITGPDDSEMFLMELSGFLREYGCAYKDLSDGPITQRLSTVDNKLRLLNYLLTELEAMRMLFINKPQLIVKPVKPDSNENPHALLLKQMLVALGFPKPPEGITSFALFSKVESKIKDILSKIEMAHMSKAILKARLSEKQWESIQYICQALNLEYELRKQMLLQRLEVTIQSFLWSDKAKKKEGQIQSMYNPIKAKLLRKIDVDLACLMAAREDLLRIEKTSGGLAREKTKCNINRVLIGNVPDRGGRAYELEPPPPEMPSFQQRQQPQQRDGGGGRGGRDDGQSRGGDRMRGGRSEGRGDSRSSGSYGSSGGWSQNQVPYGGQQQNNPAAGFFGGGGGGYGPSEYRRGGQRQGGQQDGYQQSGYQGHQQGGYQGGYQQGGYQDYGSQQGGYQQGGAYQQGGGYQQGGYQQRDGGYQNDYRQDRPQSGQDYHSRGCGGGGGGRGQGGRGRGGRR